MSGIGFQKLQGQGTTAYEQMLKLSEMIEELQKLNYPDVYKQAQMFAPQMELIAVEKKWRIENGNGSRSVNFDGRYFGYFTVSHSHNNGGASNNSNGTSNAKLFDGAQEVTNSRVFIRGDDINAWVTQPNMYNGFATSMRLDVGGSKVGAEMTVSFIGFKLGEPIITYNYTVDTELTEGFETAIVSSGINSQTVSLDSLPATISSLVNSVSISCNPLSVYKFIFISDLGRVIEETTAAAVFELQGNERGGSIKIEIPDQSVQYTFQATSNMSGEDSQPVEIEGNFLTRDSSPQIIVLEKAAGEKVRIDFNGKKRDFNVFIYNGNELFSFPEILDPYFEFDPAELVNGNHSLAIYVAATYGDEFNDNYLSIYGNVQAQGYTAGATYKIKDAATNQHVLDFSSLLGTGNNDIPYYYRGVIIDGESSNGKYYVIRFDALGFYVDSYKIEDYTTTEIPVLGDFIIVLAFPNI